MTSDRLVVRISGEQMRELNRVREEMSRGLKEGEVLCDHVPPHAVKTRVDESEQSFREWLRVTGWRDAGYCESYYPSYLRDAWRCEVGILSGYDDPLLTEEIG